MGHSAPTCTNLRVVSLGLMLLLEQGGLANAQQCYFDRGMIAPDYVVPCFPANLERGEASACCQLGDFCLTDGACFDPDSGTTYMYGCTDSTYRHANCPAKCDLDTDKSPWVGMVKCHDEEEYDEDRDDPPYTWACNHPDTCGSRCPAMATWSSAVFAQPSKPNGCKDLETIETAVVVMSWVLSGLHSLPSSVASTTSPTSSESGIGNGIYLPDPTTTETALSKSSAGVRTPSPTPEEFDVSSINSASSPTESTADGGSQNANEGGSGREGESDEEQRHQEEEDEEAKGNNEDDSGNNDLSSGATVGVSIGSTVALLAIAAACVFCWRRRRRQARQAAEADASYNNNPTTFPSQDPWQFEKKERLGPPEPQFNELPAGTEQGNGFRPVSESASTALAGGSPYRPGTASPSWPSSHRGSPNPELQRLGSQQSGPTPPPQWTPSRWNPPGSSQMPGVQDGQGGPVELCGGYVPYRAS